MNKLAVPVMKFSETMSRMAFFQNWPAEAMAHLAAGTSLVTIGKNDVLASKGETLQHLYVVISGLIRLYIPLGNDMERVVALAGAGDSLGEACLMLDEPCPYNAVAGKDSHLLAIDGHLFRRELSRHWELANQTIGLLSRRLMESLRDTEICAQRSSVQRVACYLMQHQPALDAQCYEIFLPARKQDIAAKLGLSQETFSRTLGFMQKQGLIQVDGGRIRVDNGQRLAQITQREGT